MTTPNSNPPAGAGAPGDGQYWQAERYARNARFVADLGLPVVRLLDARPGERVLDLGCGDGALTRRLAEAGVDVVGADAAADLAGAARRLGVAVCLADGHALPFVAAFDAVFSNAALHWMLEPDAVIAGVVKALKPGGRFVGEMGGHGNVAAIRVALAAVLTGYGVDTAARSPWYFPTVDDYRDRLTAAGFEVTTIELVPRPTPLPTGLEGWLDTFAGAFLAPLAADSRAEALAAVADLLRPVLCDERGRWSADYIRLRFRARLSG